jgi:hypothetical protein
MPHFTIRSLSVTVAATCLLVPSLVGHAQVSPWPAEAWSQAVNLTPIEGPGTNDFYVDLSGAYWSAATRRLWLVRNGPTNATSKVWALRENGMGSFFIDIRNGNRGEWTGFNDAEAITQADPASDTVFIMAEGEEVIRQYNLVDYGTVSLVRTFNTLPYLPVNGSKGSEGLAFVPDWALRDAGFVNGAGVPTLSHRGMGGLFLVGHQNGGRVYAFDLSATDSTFSFIGAYLTNSTDTSEVTFDPATGHILLLHGNDVNTIEIVSPASMPSGAERRLVSLRTYDRPNGSATTTNLEGLAIISDCISGHRSLFLTIDGGADTSLLWFRQFPCACPGDFDGDGTSTVSDIFGFIAAWFASDLRADFDHSGALTLTDLFDFLGAWFANC